MPSYSKKKIWKKGGYSYKKDKKAQNDYDHFKIRVFEAGLLKDFQIW